MLHPSKKNKAGQSWNQAKAILDAHNREMAMGGLTAVAAIPIVMGVKHEA